MKSGRRFVERLAVGHFFGYPLALLWSVASMPIVIHLHFAEIEKLGGDTQAMGQFVVRLTAWPAGMVFVLSHAFGIAWGLSGESPRGKWIYLGGFGVMLAVGFLFGAGSWIWLWLR